MKIIITENQNYVLRRLQQFIEIVEDQISFCLKQIQSLLSPEMLTAPWQDMFNYLTTTILYKL